MKLMLVKNRAIGDSIIGLSAIYYLKETFPALEIDYYVPSWIAPLFGNFTLNGVSIKSIDLTMNGVKNIIDQKYDIIFELHQSGRTSKVLKVLSLVLKIPYYFHNHHKESGIIIDQGVKKSIIQRDLDGLYTFLGKDYFYPNALDYIKSSYPIVKKKPQIVFGVVATRDTKKWPLENFVELALLIQTKKTDLSIVIPVSSSQEDQILKRKITALFDAKKIKNIEFLESSLIKLPNLLAGSKVYIGNDTGLKHLCAFLGVKTFTFFGPEQPNEWHPYNRSEHPYFFVNEMSCRTQTSHFCGLSYCSHLSCLREITVDKVFSEISNHL